MRLSGDGDVGKVSFVDAPGAKLAVFVSGGTQNPVVLLHGGPGVPDYLAEVAKILAPGHRVIRYDQRGTGRSTSHDGRFGLAEHVEDLEAIRKGYGHERLHLFGHSWGGTLAQLYAQRYPKRVSKLFLCDAGLGLGDSAPPPDESWLAGIRSKPMHQTRGAAIQAKSSTLGSVELASDSKVLVLFGSKDIYGPTVETLLSRYPDARYVVLENAGHLPWLQSPDTFRNELCAFFGC